MTIRLYNTKTKTKQDFAPLRPDHVRLYACGPTVYDRIHVGNARPLVVFDVLVHNVFRCYGNSMCISRKEVIDDVINVF